jgi:hypothetical protein
MKKILLSEEISRMRSLMEIDDDSIMPYINELLHFLTDTGKHDPNYPPFTIDDFNLKEYYFTIIPQSKDNNYAESLSYLKVYFDAEKTNPESSNNGRGAEVQYKKFDVMHLASTENGGIDDQFRGSSTNINLIKPILDLVEGDLIIRLEKVLEHPDYEPTFYDREPETYDYRNGEGWHGYQGRG